ncbi:hypothetical protein J6590_106533 [Homalodisca vitripennis]|nr:hypothetical protein J6590_106533 [Homalodisca vitripennis]
MERALGRRNRAEILGCVPSLQALEMGKNSLRPYGRSTPSLTRVADVTFLQGRTVSPRRHLWTNCPTFQN